MTGVARALFEPLRSLAFGGISGTYAAVGDPLDHQVKSFCITNDTEGDMIFALDNTTPEGHMFVASGSYKLYDVQSNMNAQFDDKYVIAKGTQFYVKQSTAPVSGAVYIECLY
jgi:hypothetical protein